MSITTTGSAASTTCGSTAQYELPVKDAACGVPNSSKYKSMIEVCAKPAGVQAYNNDCALYAPAVDQSVQKLTDCLYDAGVKWEDVWCFGSTNATASATSYPTATATGTLPNKTSSSTSTSTSTSTSSSTSSPNGASSVSTTQFSSKMGVVVFTLMFSSIIFGM
ncbi:hypothetical protein N7509_010578 [Penicillium cosmopolitanum]|uniref:Uncharacterized protein n=1 Tax=Penicillium cosmopolitanum TaxID=1131564 RepID=A0A9W9VRM0_9EURO|nr:uncharacterized protein N7509_010578 [Penicillium cosmopolitanum]KAJ5388037.1 hypothetical protein N7509_010578 [Penicillium cosmopolitanum]